MNNLGAVWYNMQEYEKAIEYFEKCLAVYVRFNGKYCMESADTYNNLGSVYDDMGDSEKALEYYMKGLEIQNKY